MWLVSRTSFELIFFIGACLFIPAPAYSGQLLSPWASPPQKKVLANGLTYIYQYDDSSRITMLQLLVKGGKRAEPVDKHGLAYLTARLALSIPDEAKARELMIKSSYFSMSSNGDYSALNIECLSENLEETLKLFTKMIRKPIFSGMRIDHIKKFMAHQKKLHEDDSLQVGHDACLQAFFGNSSYGASIYGDEASLEAIKGKDVENYYKKYFRANNMILSISSDLEEKNLSGIIQKYFSEFPSAESPELVLEKIESRPSSQEKEIAIERDTKQYFIAVAFPLPIISSKNFALAYAVENLLGKGPGSKLWQLRSSEKLAYNINAKVTQMNKGGILEAYLETDSSKKDLALGALKKALLDLFENDINEEELQTTKISTKAHFLRLNEMKEGKVTNLAAFEAQGLGCEFLSRFFQELDALSLEEVNAFIKDILSPEKSLVVIVGPKINNK